MSTLRRSRALLESFSFILRRSLPVLRLSLGILLHLFLLRGAPSKPGPPARFSLGSLLVCLCLGFVRFSRRLATECISLVGCDVVVFLRSPGSFISDLVRLAFGISLGRAWTENRRRQNQRVRNVG